MNAGSPESTEPEATPEESLAALSAAERIKWAARNLGPRVVATSSFGVDSAVLLHLISQAAPHLPVYLINTGFLFGETLTYRKQLEEALGLSIAELRPEIPRGEFTGVYGDLSKTDPDRCCHLNKVAVLERALHGASCWINGLRRDPPENRKGTRLMEWKSNGPVKFHPIFDWSREALEDYREQHGLPAHPLAARGYTSIGCEPCTRPPNPGDSERSGRWPGHAKSECGIHHLYQ